MSCQCTISFWFLVPFANNLEAFRHVVYPTKSRWKLKCERPAASSIAFGTCEQKAPACWAAKQRMKRWQRMSKIKMKTKAQMTNTNHSSLKNCLKTLYTPNIHMLLEFWMESSFKSGCFGSKKVHPVTAPPPISFTMAHATLIFSRHGESQWNVDNRFTGWVDATWAEINMLPMFFFFRVKAPRSCNIYIIFKGYQNLAFFKEKNTMKNLLQRGRLEVDLSAKGLGEAKSAGGLLKSEGIKVDMAFTSYLKRHLATVSLSLEQWTL